MKDIQFPVNLLFKLSTFSNDFTAKDTNDQTIAYVKQKLFKLKEEIAIYDNEAKSNVLYRINADRWIDFSSVYKITKSDGSELGKVARKGWASLWKAEYELIDQKQELQYHIREENGWIKVMDSLIGGLPVIGFLTGYFFNPTYLVTNKQTDPIVRLSKESSLLGRKFRIDKLKEIDQDDQERIILGLMMMILLERRRG